MSSKSWIEFPRVEGETSHQAHADLPAGTYEREIGRDGFFGPAAHIYHRHPPTGWTNFEGPLRPRAFDAAKAAEGGNPLGAPALLSNANVKFAIWSCTEAMQYLVRNADGDELLFIHAGEGELFCDFGHLAYREGDYILLPRGTMWRIVPGVRTVSLLIEATNNSFKLPERGILGPHAVFDPAALDTPKLDDAFRAQQGEREWQVKVKRRNTFSVITYPFNPLDAVGWKGNLAPVKLNWRDIRPVMSHRYHIPPSVHSTFVSDRFVVCTFVPRPIESDPGALKVPFFHSNDDYDEAIFYHRGEFFSRDNIHPGMVTWHPNGFTHGPHPKAFAAGAKAAKTMTDEVAVMINSRDPLDYAAPQETEFTAYAEILAHRLMEERALPLAEVIGDPAWFPDNVDINRNTFGFVQTTREALSRQSFLDARWERASVARPNILIPTVLSATGMWPRPKLNFIWHTAFCCSTLVARCLDVAGENLALKEPQIFILLAEAKRAGTLAQFGGARDAAFKLLARRHRAQESVLIKPTNAANNLIADAVHATDGRMLFLYSDCRSFLISIAKKGEMGRIFARKLFGLFAADGHPQAKWPMQTLFELSDLQVAALVWHMQIAEFRRAREVSRSAALNCDSFLADPRETLSRLNDFFDLNLSPAKLDANATGPLLSQNAKDMTQAFSAERRAAEAGDIAKSLGSELDIVVEWSFRACPETPRENPLGPTL